MQLSTNSNIFIEYYCDSVVYETLYYNNKIAFNSIDEMKDVETIDYWNRKDFFDNLIYHTN